MSLLDQSVTHGVELNEFFECQVAKPARVNAAVVVAVCRCLRKLPQLLRGFLPVVPPVKAPLLFEQFYFVESFASRKVFVMFLHSGSFRAQATSRDCGSMNDLGVNRCSLYVWARIIFIIPFCLFECRRSSYHTKDHPHVSSLACGRLCNS